MTRLVHLAFQIAAVPAVFAVLAGMALQKVGGWVIHREQELRR